MNSPTQALLWEIWRVTRLEAAWKFGIGVVGSLTALAVIVALSPIDDPTRARNLGAAVAMVFIVAPQFLGWLLLPKLNSGLPGFPLRLLYTWPVSTAAMVGLPLAYLSLLPALIYLVSALLLRAITDFPFPLLSVAAWIAVLNLGLTVASWSAGKTSVVTLIGMALSASWMLFAVHRVTSWPDGARWYDSPSFWPTIFDFPLTDYAWIAAIALAAFAIAVARVARQRRGDVARAGAFWTPGAGYPEGFVNLVRFPCPTTSPTLAQLWFDLRSRGMPVLTLGLSIAILIPLLFTISVPVDAVITEHFRSYVSCADRGCFYLRPMALMFSGLCLLALLFQGGNAFGIRYKQGRIYLSAFETTQAIGAAQLSVLKLLVRSGCFLAALLIVGLSVWLSLPIFGDVLFLQMFETPLLGMYEAINRAFAALSGTELLAMAVVGVTGAFMWSAGWALTGALWLRYPRRGNLTALALLMLGLALGGLVLAGRYGHASALIVDTVFTVVSWTALVATIAIILYVCWRSLAERVLTIRYLVVSVLIAAAFAASWSAVVPGASDGFPMWSALLPLFACILAPWSFNRLRHL